MTPGIAQMLKQLAVTDDVTTNYSQVRSHRLGCFFCALQEQDAVKMQPSQQLLSDSGYNLAACCPHPGAFSFGRNRLTESKIAPATAMSKCLRNIWRQQWRCNFTATTILDGFGLCAPFGIASSAGAPQPKLHLWGSNLLGGSSWNWP